MHFNTFELYYRLIVVFLRHHDVTSLNPPPLKNPAYATEAYSGPDAGGPPGPYGPGLPFKRGPTFTVYLLIPTSFGVFFLLFDVFIILSSFRLKLYQMQTSKIIRKTTFTEIL